MSESSASATSSNILTMARSKVDSGTKLSMSFAGGNPDGFEATDGAWRESRVVDEGGSWIAERLDFQAAVEDIFGKPVFRNGGDALWKDTVLKI